MVQGESTCWVLIPITIEEWNSIKGRQDEILKKLEEIKNASNGSKQTISSGYITAIEFMQAVNISRSFFDALIVKNKIRTIKKSRKIYVLATEVERYFKDPSI